VEGLSVEGVGWRYGRGPWIFRDLSVAVRPGQLLRVSGGNGTGKSTLLGLLAGRARPRRGTVRVGPVAYLPQPGGALPELPVRRLLALLGGDPAGDPVVAEHAGVRADRLSSGTARRVLLAAVLDLPARVLVLDEPTAFLDAAAATRLAARIERRRAAGHAVVLADHELLPVAADHTIDLGGLLGAGLARVVLAGSGTLRGAAAVDGRLELTVPVAERDALLLDALTAGWQVLTVESR
jgi:ABC-type Mn2+/Zn2+ transport system ATPase subunit